MDEQEFDKLNGKLDCIVEQVSDLTTSHNYDRQLLKDLHNDHIVLSNKVRMLESNLIKTSSDLDSHVQIACIIQESIKKDVNEIKQGIKDNNFSLNNHMRDEEADRKEIIKYLQTKLDGKSDSFLKTFLQMSSIGVTIIIFLSGLLWAVRHSQ